MWPGRIFTVSREDWLKYLTMKALHPDVAPLPGLTNELVFFVLGQTITTIGQIVALKLAGAH
jgi:hypothetical protein